LSDDKDKLVILEREEHETSSMPREESATPWQLGRWYWVNGYGEGHGEKSERWFGCVVALGTNYAALENVAVYASTTRVHFDNFEATCTPISDAEADAHINQMVGRHHARIRELRAQVQELTRRLGIAPTSQLAAGETSALAVRGASSPDMKSYSAELVLAQEKTLPSIFEAMRAESEKVGLWLGARALPLQGQVGSLEHVLGAVKTRIFNVQLYAGLTEEIWQVKDGAPAAPSDKIHVLQRRAYMDEECLLKYEAGGMEFKDIHAFDAWLARPDNLNRLMPFPRTLLAFRVRRNAKERGEIDAWLKFRLERADKSTYLYMRNGEQLFCLETAIEFDEKLFPDLDRQLLNGKIYAERGDDPKAVISEAQYQAYRQDLREYKAYRRLSKKKQQGHPREKEFDWHWREKDYVLYDQNTVYFDDITTYLQDEVARHNRLVLVLQGLLDRSPVFQPHPPWQLWKSGVFEEALHLVFDDSRALVPGEAPDFEAYMAELGKSIGPGSIVMGQDPVWAAAQADKAPRYYWRHGYPPESYRPDGNPGPGRPLARVASVSRAGECLFRWKRERLREPRDRLSLFRSRRGLQSHHERFLPCTFTVKREQLFHVSAYKPGDMKRFFADPRTRGDYLKWAPFMLAAEDYHAGKISEQMKKRLAGEGADGADED
jgi:hypothetical protein